jgi:hypothetical protein
VPLDRVALLYAGRCQNAHSFLAGQFLMPSFEQRSRKRLDRLGMLRDQLLRAPAPVLDDGIPVAAFHPRDIVGHSDRFPIIIAVQIKIAAEEKTIAGGARETHDEHALLVSASDVFQLHHTTLSKSIVEPDCNAPKWNTEGKRAESVRSFMETQPPRRLPIAFGLLLYGSAPAPVGSHLFGALLQKARRPGNVKRLVGKIGGDLLITRERRFCCSPGNRVNYFVCCRITALPRARDKPTIGGREVRENVPRHCHQIFI